ncbi:C40 family peptidase [Ammoniphilus sp. CFH 90114]|uniref:C40 family peptidase n=1 Tax=Ammoniphilus sp. CFH 90114 TaxID=2493665 RepID=UPI00100FCC7D|nr:C40 family peptidase [Ammoniphilus sp. CFH 90114]RXT07958.1 NlpC/P60 family protein [Ammoniphilus sp. CFH 90114]
MKRPLALLVAAMTITSSSIVLSFAGQASAQTFQTQATTGQKIIQAGMKYIGTPYEFGSDRTSKRTFDCSDFTRRAYLDVGIRIPSNSRTQAEHVRNLGKTSTKWQNLKPGDLMFFMSYRGVNASSYAGLNKFNQRITHVAIYLGNGKILHTYSNQSGGVRIDSISGRHWEHRFIFGGSATQ